ncbi:MAG: rRNA pseudouridine synthase [Calditrichaeota bacterium]|nr:rRNA pseudouridine synthase [Calditrichota bacterium]MCB9366500.1 rRNA pseudouridine synthase [Calditrichota bacterium]MCB9391242.1 rRNA pseudouridine synthase [Calditrichota bacterium]
MLNSERINRYLARCGVCSRREADRLIAEGRVTVNGKTVRELGIQIDPMRDTLEVDGERVAEAQDPTVIAFHKPVGVLSTCRAGRETGAIITEYLPSGRRLYPIGRLDKDSCGLLLVTDDGDLANLLMHPRYGSHKTYLVDTEPPLTRRQYATLARGVILEDGPARPAALRQVGEHSFEIILSEGRKRQIRRMVAAVGARVTKLTRIEQAGIRLGSLPPGKWRELSASEIKRLKESLQSGSSPFQENG